MNIRFLRNWSSFHEGQIVEIGPNSIGQGQFIELKQRGIVEVIEDGPPEYQTAVAAQPKRKRGRPRKCPQ